MKTDEVYAKLLGCSVSGYYKWKKQKRIIFSFLEKCFSKEELETYLLTGKIPSKIELANQLYAGVYDDFTDFIAHAKKNKIYLMLLFLQGSLDNAQEKAFDLYDQQKISRKALSEFIAVESKNLTYALSLYIQENMRFDWRLLEQDSLKGFHKWVPLYLEIIGLSIKQGLFEKAFGDENNTIEQIYVPNHPWLFACYHPFEEVELRYQEVLETVRDAFLNNTLDALPLWSIYEGNFTMDTQSKEAKDAQADLLV